MDLKINQRHNFLIKNPKNKLLNNEKERIQY